MCFSNTQRQRLSDIGISQHLSEDFTVDELVDFIKTNHPDDYLNLENKSQHSVSKFVASYVGYKIKSSGCLCSMAYCGETPEEAITSLAESLHQTDQIY